ncbi:three-Cys-motif partner protein TcmP [Geobacillus kaustophilus]|uniref:three-Cys-motif partner protein TcmP n=1 Tax=Geobacillus kaustophilus TaxID=1462 RepID=UPI0005CCCC1A|nr:three-Cys-motif partner protein TcmP [Geobacillus kaustophilus]
MAYGEKDNLIGSWSLDKLEFLRKYLPIYIKATSKAIHRYYVDCFAGRGKWIEKESLKEVDGSVSISLDYSGDFTKLFYIELNEDRVKDIEKLASVKSPKRNYEIIKGDCNVMIRKVMPQIHPKAPTFVFIDPSSDQVKWSTIEYLSKWRTELFILYPYQMTIRRYLPKDTSKIQSWQIERLNDFFGTNLWYDIYINHRRTYLLSKLLDLYTNRLKEIGYKYVNVSDVFKKPSGPDLYYMIWVGKHKAGNEIMKWVYEQQNPQLSLF